MNRIAASFCSAKWWKAFGPFFFSFQPSCRLKDFTFLSLSLSLSLEMVLEFFIFSSNWRKWLILWLDCELPMCQTVFFVGASMWQHFITAYNDFEGVRVSLCMSIFCQICHWTDNTKKCNRKKNKSSSRRERERERERERSRLSLPNIQRHLGLFGSNCSGNHGQIN